MLGRSGERSPKSEGQGWQGVRLAEQIVGAVFTIADHLRTASGKYRIPENACLRPAKWRKLLKDDWHAVTGKEVQPRRLRYDRKELRAIVRGLRSTDDARLRTAGVYGIGYRRAHVVRVRRSMLDLGPVGAYNCGRLTIPGGRRKKGGIVDLTPAQHAHFVRILGPGGYLEDLEEARKAGEIADYYLLTAGRFRAGKAQLQRANRHIHRDDLSRRFEALEKAVGVRHMPGRGWHGLRRSMSDEIAEETTDETARDLAQGFAPGGGTRAQIYMDREHEAKLARATAARNAALRRLAEGTGAGDLLATEVEVVERTLANLQSLAEQQRVLDLTAATSAAEALRSALEQASLAASELSETCAYDGEETGRARHLMIEAEICEEIRRRGLTGKKAAELIGAHRSDVSAILGGRSLGVVRLSRLERFLVLLRTAPETVAGWSPKWSPESSGKTQTL